MSNWSGKYVVGVTGNIATGKSVVRKMLEHLGAYTIDADALAHRAMAKGAPAYQPIVNHFGKWILKKNGEIDRKKLGQLVFGVPDALKVLESLVHPFVGQAINYLVKRSKQDVVVIEAIKLLESDLAAKCDSIWVVDAPEAVQISRLMQKRGFDKELALRYVRAQNDRDLKLNLADILINNTSSFKALWKQVLAGWEKIPDIGKMSFRREASTVGNFVIKRGHPRDAKTIALLMSRLSGMRMTAADVMEAFGEKAFFILSLGKTAVGLAGWQVENLVTRTTDLYIAPEVDAETALKALIEEIETASRALQSEVSLLFLNKGLAAKKEMWKSLGYEKRTPKTLGVQVWQEAAQEVLVPGKTLCFKQLRVDRVLRPM